MKINSKSSMKGNMFSKSLIKKGDMPYADMSGGKYTERVYHTAGTQNR